MPRRPCKGTTKAGKPCKAAPCDGTDYCRAHNPLLPDEMRFGSPTQAGNASRGVERRFPRLREVVATRIEAKAERIVDAQLEALDATRLIVDEKGREHVHPDYLTRLRAGDTLTSRALGRPMQEQHVKAEHQVLAVSLDTADPEVRHLVGELLRHRPAARS